MFYRKQHWFRCLKNNDFDAEDKERSGALKKFEDKELEALLHEDSYQAQAEITESLGVVHTLVLKSIRNVSKIRTLGAIQTEKFFAPYHDWQ